MRGVLLGYLAACTVASFVISLLFHGTVFRPSFGLYFVVLLCVSAISLIPTMIIVGIGFQRRFTGWRYYALLGGALGFVLSYLFGGPTADSHFRTLQIMFSVAGFVGGSTFWLIATEAGLFDRMTGKMRSSDGGVKNHIKAKSSRATDTHSISLHPILWPCFTAQASTMPISLTCSGLEPECRTAANLLRKRLVDVDEFERRSQNP